MHIIPNPQLKNKKNCIDPQTKAQTFPQQHQKDPILKVQ